MKRIKPHLDLAFEYWKAWLKPGDTVIDATCGNGKDTLRLASLVPVGRVLALDIQEDAIMQAKKVASLENVYFFHQSHISFPLSEPVKLIVYNLGYLPFGNKSVTTLSMTTLKSLDAALKSTFWGGAISLTCYPGHPEGLVEQEAIFTFIKTLDPQTWKIAIHRWKEGSPCFIWIEKMTNNYFNSLLNR